LFSLSKRGEEQKQIGTSVGIKDVFDSWEKVPSCAGDCVQVERGWDELEFRAWAVPGEIQMDSGFLYGTPRAEAVAQRSICGGFGHRVGFGAVQAQGQVF